MDRWQQVQLGVDKLKQDFTNVNAVVDAGVLKIKHASDTASSELTDAAKPVAKAAVDAAIGGLRGDVNAAFRTAEWSEDDGKSWKLFPGPTQTNADMDTVCIGGADIWAPPKGGGMGLLNVRNDSRGVLCFKRK